MEKENNKVKAQKQIEDEQEQSIGKVQDRMTQMPKKKVPWTTIIIIFIVLALFYAVITLAFS